MSTFWHKVIGGLAQTAVVVNAGIALHYQGDWRISLACTGVATFFATLGIVALKPLTAKGDQ